jgi:hypothetical protein
MIIKTLISYENWLILTRDSVTPEIGDKIITNSAARDNKDLQYSIVKKITIVDEPYNSKYKYVIGYKQTSRVIEELLVEVEVESSDLKL